MKTKDLNKEQTVEKIEQLKKRIAFNNELNKFVRKFNKANKITNSWNVPEGFIRFNGYHDEPTEGMKSAMTDILLHDLLGDTSWMSASLKTKYASETGAIFGEVYSSAVNRYVLDDLHDCEKHLANLEQAEQKNKDNAETDGLEETEYFKVQRDLSENRLNLYFEDIPSSEERVILKRNGFKWSPYLSAWTRQLTSNAEHSLQDVIKEFDVLYK